MKRILVRRRGALGDVLNTTPIVRRLRQENPDAEITIETFHHQVYFNNRDANRVIVPIDLLEYDRIVELNGVYENRRNVHQVVANLEATFGDNEGDKTIKLPHPIFERDSKSIVIHPATSWPSRTFSQSFWSNIGKQLYDMGYKIVITGSKNDAQVIIPNGVVYDARGRFSLDQQAALIESADCFLCSDSGLVTLCGATETPAVVLTTMTRADLFLPFRHGELGWNFHELRTPLSCYNCGESQPPVEYFECKRGDNACVNSISVESVVERVQFAITNDRRQELK